MSNEQIEINNDNPVTGTEAPQSAQSPDQLPDTDAQAAQERVSILQVTPQGDFTWHPDAAELLDNDAHWPEGSDWGTRTILRALYSTHSLPNETRQAYETMRIPMPANLQEGTQEFYAEFSWRLWKAAVAYGQRFMLFASAKERAQIYNTFQAICTTYGNIAYRTGQGETIPEADWMAADEILRAGNELLPRLEHLVGERPLLSLADLRQQFETVVAPNAGYVLGGTPEQYDNPETEKAWQVYCAGAIYGYEV